MFAELKQLIAANGQLTLTLTAGADDTLTVVLLPGGDNPVLSVPLALTGTCAELDTSFADLVGQFVAKRHSMSEQLQAAEALMANAVRDKAKASQSKSKTVKPEPDNDEGDDEEGDGEDAPAVAPHGSPRPIPRPVEKAVPADPLADLF